MDARATRPLPFCTCCRGPGVGAARLTKAHATSRWNHGHTAHLESPSTFTSCKRHVEQRPAKPGRGLRIPKPCGPQGQFRWHRRGLWCHFSCQARPQQRRFFLGRAGWRQPRRSTRHPRFAKRGSGTRLPCIAELTLERRGEEAPYEPP